MGQISQQKFDGSRCAPCKKLDLIFALESDAYLNAANFESAKKFIQLFATNYKTNMDSGSYLGDFPQLGVVTWNGADPGTAYPVPLTSNFTLFNTSVGNLPFINSYQSNFTDGLLFSHEELVAENSDEKTARVVVLITFGNNVYGSWFPLNGELRAARLLKQQGTYVLGVVVGAQPPSFEVASWLQFAAISSYFGYNFTTWAVNSFDDLTNTSYVARMTNFTCKLDPLPRLFRPACPSQLGSYAKSLKAYPPGNYALGTFLPDNYTTWGYLNVPPPPGDFTPLSFTVEFWVFLRSSPKGKQWTFLSQSPRDGLNESSYSLFVGSTDGQVLFVVGNGGNDSSPYLRLQTTRRLQEKVWYHIAVNLEMLDRNASFWPDLTDEKYASVWVNGEVWSRSVFTFPTAPGTGIIQVGRTRNLNGTQRCNCVFDEIKIWSQCQTMAQLGARANILLSGKEPKLVAYYNFEDVTKVDFDDVSVNKRVATQFGASPWIVQVAESTPKCTNSIIPDLRDFETVCNGP